MKLLDSRRFTGPQTALGPGGGVLDVALSDEGAGPVTQALGSIRRAASWKPWSWGAEELCVRRFSGGASLALSAQIDRLYSATEVNEWAWEAAMAAVAGHEPSGAELSEAASRLREAIDWEKRPDLLALRDAAGRRRISLLWDADTSPRPRLAARSPGRSTTCPPRARVDWARGCTTSPCSW